MPVEVYGGKKKENPLDNLAKIASIGVGVASLGSKAGGADTTGVSEVSDDGGAMDRRLDEIEYQRKAAMDSFEMPKPKPSRFNLGIKG